MMDANRDMITQFPSTFYMTELKLSYSYSHSNWIVAVLCAIVPALMDHLAPPYKVWIIYDIQYILLLKELLEICLFLHFLYSHIWVCCMWG